VNNVTKNERQKIYKSAADLAAQGHDKYSISAILVADYGISLCRSRNAAAHGILIARARRRLVSIEDYR